MSSRDNYGTSFLEAIHTITTLAQACRCAAVWFCRIAVGVSPLTVMTLSIRLQLSLRPAA
jgi:hypothetical protein